MTLTICNDDHDEIVYNDNGRRGGNACPLCEALRDKKEIEGELERAQDALNDHP